MEHPGLSRMFFSSRLKREATMIVTSDASVGRKKTPDIKVGRYNFIFWSRGDPPDHPYVIVVSQVVSTCDNNFGHEQDS